MSNFFLSPAEHPTGQDDFDLKLTKATSGLVYISETDAPLKPFRIALAQASDIAGTIREYAGIPETASTAIASFDDLFARLTRKHEGANEISIRLAERFAELRDTLKAELSDLTVLRFGTIRIRIFVAGRSSDRSIRGFETESVET